jgi:hypothetical protein
LTTAFDLDRRSAARDRPTFTSLENRPWRNDGRIVCHPCGVRQFPSALAIPFCDGTFVAKTNVVASRFQCRLYSSHIGTGPHIRNKNADEAVPTTNSAGMSSSRFGILRARSR